MRIFTSVLAMAGMLMLTACGSMDRSAAPALLTEKQTKMLAKELDGKVAGTAANCISRNSSSNFIRISDDMLIYRDGRVTYQNKLRYSCPGLARDDDILVIRTWGSQYCEGDLIQLVDRSSGIPGPTCSLGEFIPYRKAQAG